MTKNQSITYSTENPQIPYDAAVIIPTTLRPTLLQAVRSVFTQDWAGRIQILIGADIVTGDVSLIDRLREECPERMAITYLDLGYSTSIAHGGTGPNPYGGNLRALLSFAANSDLICYLDDDNWWAQHHVSDLTQAIEGYEWAYSYRWLVDGADDRVLCVDDFESVGPGRGIHNEKFGGFVDTNCLMINRRHCMEILPNWSIPFIRDGSGEDRRVFDALKRTRSVGWTTRPSVYYRLNPGRGISKPLNKLFRERNIQLSTPQTEMDNSFIRQQKLVEEYLSGTKITKLNIGAGTVAQPGWLNTDLVPVHSTIFVMNAAKRFPFRDNAFDFVASEHMIEHLTFRDGLKMLHECHRVLKPGGRIRIATPDLSKFVSLFSTDPEEIQKRYQDWIMRTFLPDIRGSHPTFVMNNIFYNWGHRFIYDEQILGNAMKISGFENLMKFRPGISDDPELVDFEIHGEAVGTPWLNEYETLVIEGRKPE